MKRSYLLTLIILALFLCSADVNAQPSPWPTKEPNKSASFGNQQSQQYKSPVSTPYISQTPEQGSAPDTKQKDGDDASTVIITLFTVVSGLAAAAIAWFNCQLVSVTRDLHKATEQMTKAADKSAEAATLALNVEKPYVFVESPRLETPIAASTQLFLPSIDVVAAPYFNIALSRSQTNLVFQVRNRGKGLAIIEEISIKQSLMRNRLDPRGKHTRMMRKEYLTVMQRVMGPSEFAEQRAVVPDPVIPPSIGLMTDSRYALIGFVRYRDVFERRYKSYFCYVYEYPLLFTAGEPFFYANGERRNRIQEQ